MEIRIPDSHKGTFSMIAAAEPERIQEMLKALRGLRPSLSLRAQTESLAKAGLEKTGAEGLLRVLSSLYGLRDYEEIGVDELTKSVAEAVDAAEGLEVSAEGRQRIVDFVGEALSLDATLGVTAKAWYVVHDAERTYCRSRVLTDLRPVFQPGTTIPSAFAVVHNLKIAYHEGDELREFFVSLTSDDVDQLQQTLKRAAEKQGSLKALLDPKELTLLEEG